MQHMILALRTDKPDAELFLLQSEAVQASYTWRAHRALSDTLLKKIEALMRENGVTKTDISGIVVYQGPGSFTGLRIGITVANTLAYAWGVPIVAAQGEQWLATAEKHIAGNVPFKSVVPEYGSDVRITSPRK